MSLRTRGSSTTAVAVIAVGRLTAAWQTTRVRGGEPGTAPESEGETERVVGQGAGGARAGTIVSGADARPRWAVQCAPYG